MISLQKILFGKRYFDRRIYLFFLLGLSIILFDLLAIYHSWYYAYGWLDIPVHAAAGALLAVTIYYVVYINRVSSQYLQRAHTAENVFSDLVFWVLIIALSWEIVEFIWGRTTLTPNYALDLFTDVAVTAFSAVAVYLLISYFNKNLSKKLP